MTKRQRDEQETRLRLAEDYANNPEEYKAVTQIPKLRTEKQQKLFRTVRARKISKSAGVEKSRAKRRLEASKEASTIEEKEAILKPFKERTTDEQNLIKRMQSRRYQSRRVVALSTNPFDQSKPSENA